MSKTGELVLLYVNIIYFIELHARALDFNLITYEYILLKVFKNIVNEDKKKLQKPIWLGSQKRKNIAEKMKVSWS